MSYQVTISNLTYFYLALQELLGTDELETRILHVNSHSNLSI